MNFDVHELLSLAACHAGSRTTPVAGTGLFLRRDEAKIQAKIGRVAPGEPARPAKLLKTKKLMLAERVGFEPTCPVKGKTLSRRPRYDHFGTSPHNRARFDRRNL